MEASAGGGRVDLPPGVKIGPGRETTQTNGQGQIVQGMVFPITTPNGSTTSVFIPSGELENTAAVRAAIARKVNAIEAIAG